MSPLGDLLARYHAERGGSLGETAQGVLELSRMFNGLTPHRPGYLAAGRLRRAYIHYYLPVNAEKVARVLAEMDAYAPAKKKLRVLDYGCGPGTAAIAAILQGRVGELTLVDVVDEALDDARFFCRALGVEPRTMHAVPEEEFDLILAANVFSEHPAPLEERLAERGYLIVIEPALQEATRRLELWRDQQVLRGYRIAAPCLGRAACPMLERDDLWCHQDLAWPRPAPVAEIDRRLGLSKESLKFSYAVLTPQGPTRHRSEATAAFFHADRGQVLSIQVEGGFCRSRGPIERVL